MEDRKKILELFSKQLSEGNPLAEEFVNMKKSPMSQSLQARDLAEDALAHQVLKNTGVPIPSPGASQLKQEDFLNRIMKEQYPELEPDIQFKDLGKDLGQYGQGKIDINKNLSSDPLKSLSTAFHEGAHQYDDKILKFDGTDDILKKQLMQNVPEGRLLKDIDPMQMAEIINKGHHARIPNLRDADSFGLGALKSMLKSGTFRGLAGPVAGLGIGAAMMTDEASAADFIPGLDQADNAGSAMDDRMMKGEVKALQNYDQSQARKDALNRIKSGR